MTPRPPRPALAGAVGSLATLLAVACYRPGAVDCVLKCGPGCPQGMRCSNGWCTAGESDCPLATPPVCAVCNTATSSNVRCSGDQPVRCNGSTSMWIAEGPACAAPRPYCHEGTCHECMPGQPPRCQDSCSQPCDSGGHWASIDRCTPCTAASAPADRPQLAAGASHTCALLDSGRVYCWGSRAHGQLGVDVNVGGDPARFGALPGEMERLPPVDLGADSTGASRLATAVAAGGRHTCAVLAGQGFVKCWGDNSYGQLGQGDTIDRGRNASEMGNNLHAVDLGGAIATAIAAGDRHSCALLQGGGGGGLVKCWGDNSYGQLGQGDMQSRGAEPCEVGLDLPAVDLGMPAIAIAAGGFHTCALLADDTVRCWGSNSQGQLGVAGGARPGVPLTSSPLPIAVDVGAHRVVALAAGFEHTCALVDGGQAICWGRNSSGQLGVDSYQDRYSTSDGVDPFVLLDPPAGTPDASIVDLATGDAHTCALWSTGAVQCWGLAMHGQLGLGDAMTRGRQVGDMAALPTVDLAPAQRIVAGGSHTCARLASGEVKCWGDNAYGELGLDDDADRGGAPGQMGDALPAVVVGGPLP